MQIVKRAALAFTFIFALLAMPAVANDFFEESSEDGVFTENPIPEGVNQAFVITECGEIIVAGIAVFEGPDDVKGNLIVISRGVLPIPMEVIVAGRMIDYKADGPVIELSTLADRMCI